MHYPRPELARHLVDALLGKSPFNDARNGLFLAAPRRTGKSTFLRNDLTPSLQSEGVVVVYVDLWSDRSRDPGDLIAAAIGAELRKHLPYLERMAKKIGLENISLGGAAKFDLSKIGKTDGMTLAEALRTLIDAARKPVALIIDEAQQALVSESGEVAMAALKAARDQINTPDKADLLLIMSGSDRDKLMRLTNSNSAPFFGSTVASLPLLDHKFVAFLASAVERMNPEVAPVAVEKLVAAFARVGHRPQLFLGMINEAAGLGTTPRRGFEVEIEKRAQQLRDENERLLEATYTALEPLQQALLWRMLELGPKFRPFDASARDFYSQQTGAEVSSQAAQKALDALRDQVRPLVWKSGRGEYSVEDQGMIDWFKTRRDSGAWPPGTHAQEPAAT